MPCRGCAQVAAQAAPGSIAVAVRGGIEIHRGVFAFAGPRWRIRPYAELYLVNILRRAGQIAGHLFLGLSVLVR